MSVAPLAVKVCRHVVTLCDFVTRSHLPDKSLLFN